MRYAIISDIHGNFDALSAILQDAKNHNVDKYIFVGDYCASLPYPNEVADTMQGLANTITVKGNAEVHLAQSAKDDQSTWTDGQYQTHYWLYRNLTVKNHMYLREMPTITTLNDSGINIIVTHKSSDIYGNIEYKHFNSRKVAEKYQSNFTSRDKILYDIQEYVRIDNDFHAAIQPLEDGIYIFGHSHIQWYAQHENKIFINPGSCGFPLDGVSGAPYTLLEIENSKVKITERRPQYDTERLVQNFINSDLYKAAPVWSKLILEQLTGRFEIVWSFLVFAEKYANEIGDHVRPFSVSTWTDAFRLWKEDRPRLEPHS